MLTPIKIQTNHDAIEMLEHAIERVKSGEIISVGVSWVTSDQAIAGDISKGGNNIMMWAALEHVARSFYADVINED